jgi:ATP-binding cassette subfamily B protein
LTVSDLHTYEEEDFSTSLNRKTLLRILGELKPFWRWVLGFIFCIAVVSILEALFTYLNKVMVDNVIQSNSASTLYSVLAMYAVLGVSQALNVYGFIYLAGVLGQKVEYALRKRVFEHLQKLSLSYFDRTPVGWIMSRCTSDAERIAELVTWGLLDTTWALLNICTSMFFMITINWQLALIVLLCIPVLLVVASQFQMRILRNYRTVRKLNSKMTGVYNENITGVRVVKALGREEANLREFSDLTRDMYDSSYRAASLSALFLPCVQVISAVAVGAVIYFGGSQITLNVLGTSLTIGGLQAFISYITFMLWPVQDLARVYAEMQRSIASAERIFSLLDSTPEIVDRPGAKDAATLAGEIVFDHVDFWYKPDQPILRDFSLTLRPGEMVALVGPTGSGKSTIVNLLCRFYEPTGGAIRINGLDYTQLTLHSIHSRLGVVLQTPRLFSGSIRDNLRYGRLDASDEQVEAAAKLVGAHEFISTLKKGYDEQVGEGGVLLSVGQKQLISLARAVLANPELLIMDEATSSVDTLTEALIQRGMETLMKGRTSVIIAHRLSTIRRADRILVIDKGQIIEQGTHAELLRLGGHYYKLYTKQFRHEIDAALDDLEMESKSEPETATASAA